VGRTFIAKRNRFLCLALALITGVVTGIGFLLFGGGFVMGAGHSWPYPLFMAVYGVYLIGVPVVPIVAAYLTYRIIRAVVGTMDLTGFDSDETTD
jgi:hypothetical protein